MQFCPSVVLSLAYSELCIFGLQAAMSSCVVLHSSCLWLVYRWVIGLLLCIASHKT